MNGNAETRKLYFWMILPGILAGVAAIISSIAVLILILQPREAVQSKSQEMQNQEKGITLLHEEITYRFEDMRSSLDHEPLLTWQFRHAIAGSTLNGVGISERYRDTQLKTLLFELEQVSPDDEKAVIEEIRKLLDELAVPNYDIPASDGEVIDPEIAQWARDKFAEVEMKWQSILIKHE